MNLKTLYELLLGTGLPVAYRQFNKPICFPVIVYYETSSNNFFADGKTYHPQSVVNVELYTDDKDPQSESLIEELFDTNEIAWEKDETYLEDEKCYLILYRIEV